MTMRELHIRNNRQLISLLSLGILSKMQWECAEETMVAVPLKATVIVSVSLRFALLCDSFPQMTCEIPRGRG